MGTYASGNLSKAYLETKDEAGNLAGFVSATGFGKTVAIVSGPNTETGTTDYAGGQVSYKTGTLTFKAHQTETKDKLEAAMDGNRHVFILDRKSTADTQQFNGVITDIAETTVDGVTDPTFTVTIQQTSDFIAYTGK